MIGEAPLVLYVCLDNEGPVFERGCPWCGRFLKFPKQINWTVAFDDSCRFQTIDCSKCGPVEPEHVGWSGDYT